MKAKQDCIATHNRLVAIPRFAYLCIILIKRNLIWWCLLCASDIGAGDSVDSNIYIYIYTSGLYTQEVDG